MIFDIYVFTIADLFLERGDENEHDYHRNITELDHSFAQTTIKDEPKFTTVTDNQVKIEQRPSVSSNPNSAAVTSQSALVKLLTTNSPMNAVKTEPEPENFGFDEAEMQYRKYYVCFVVVCFCRPSYDHCIAQFVTFIDAGAKI